MSSESSNLKERRVGEFQWFRVSVLFDSLESLWKTEKLTQSRELQNKKRGLLQWGKLRKVSPDWLDQQAVVGFRSGMGIFTEKCEDFMDFAHAISHR